jgi:hypothetical protein
MAGEQKPRRPIVNQLLKGALVLAATIATYGAIGMWQHGSRDQLPSSPVSLDAAPVNPFESANGSHLIAFVVTASDCGWSKRPDGMKAVRVLKPTLQASHGSSFARISVIGVDLDDNLDVGLRFLADIGNGSVGGAFDQIVVGGSWLNEEIVKLVWREGTAEPASPQILVIERHVDATDYMASSRLKIGDDTVVAHLVGENAIVKWLKEGQPLRSKVQRRATGG